MEHLEFLERLDVWMRERGFFPFRNTDGQFFRGLYWRAENPVFYVIAIGDGGRDDPRRWQEVFTAAAEAVQEQAEEMHCTRKVCLCLLTDTAYCQETADFVAAREISFDDPIQYIWWYFPLDQRRLYTGKDQPKKMLGLEKMLIAAAGGEGPVPMTPAAQEMTRPVVTWTIFAICALILAGMYLTGRKEEWIYAFGSGWEGVVEQRQYYRMVTSMFLHDGPLHLAANSIYLFYFGVPVERLLGRGRFVLLFLLSGLCGNLLSLFCGGWLGVGASGAIFGLLGTALLWTKERGAQATGMNYATMLLLALTALGMGWLDTGVDNYAHLGGFLCGMALFLLFRRKERKKTAH
ncbi:rhomboid family intramembrane serine protease [Anaerotignum lactatifermentans]|uniref:Rhomboid family intramembrane serine protease n=1 Tax=Anaerotignum lactatifermentans TaxID=160404 RepID=A0ABS2GAH5_9FIRM|nr:rhomboid family intramembrane serine protease [Anaerotignum lactatifermentans]MBM6829928.1 rhomboid family intramembrane serine protease [Anaerotignum lactatifermentans]MBM6878431.1 rhomboid family intramembrane serine protease [Anaerotignum lactatifermentans]MBM6951647.1 rhomboid family intramembrane serine protease [Anaerotignum lactatifermentans]